MGLHRISEAFQWISGVFKGTPVVSWSFKSDSWGSPWFFNGVSGTARSSLDTSLPNVSSSCPFLGVKSYLAQRLLLSMDEVSGTLTL